MTNDTGAAEITLVGQVQIAASANAATETGGDFVIAQINVRAATGTIRGRCLIADFVLSLAFETGDDAITLATPNIFEFAMKRNLLRGARFVFGLERRWRKRPAALPANRRLGRHIFHLLEATVRTFHTGLSRRRFGH